MESHGLDLRPSSLPRSATTRIRRHRATSVAIVTVLTAPLHPQLRRLAAVMPRWCCDPPGASSSRPGQVSATTASHRSCCVRPCL